MKRKKILLTAFFSGMTACFLLSGCIKNKQVVGEAEITSIQADTVIKLKPEADNSPTCKIHLDFMYLKPFSEQDSLSQEINSTLQGAFSDERFRNLPTSKFIDSIRNSYITSYRDDLLNYYEADLQNKTIEDIPAWYNYEYDVTSELSIGRDSIWNYAITSFQNTGGAHPNTWTKWLNIESTTGKLLTKNTVFLSGSEKAICDLILKYLLIEANKRLNGSEQLQDIDDLHEVGILLDGDLYVPDNFLLASDGITFLFNRYEIAPYSMGDFQPHIPYAEIETYLIKK